MSPEQFTYWLQGFAELNATPPTQEQWQSIRDHLATVFKKVTPVVGPAIAAPARDPLPGDTIRRALEDAAKKRDPWPVPGVHPFGPAIC